MARFDLKYSDVHIFSARHIAYLLSALYAVARPPVRPSDGCIIENDWSQGRRHGVGRVGKCPPWKKSGWAMHTLEFLAVV